MQPGEPSAQEAQNIAEQLPAEAWSKQLIKEGSQGPMVAEFAMVRVVAVRDGLPGPDVWLVIRRALDKKEEKYLVSNAPAQIETSRLCKMSAMRWPIEICFEDSKQLVGMGDYEVRSWRGWHHHMTQCLLAYFFLVRVKLKYGDKAPTLTLPQVQLILSVVLAKRKHDTMWVLEVTAYHIRRNHATYISHRKRRVEQLNDISFSPL